MNKKFTFRNLSVSRKNAYVFSLIFTATIGCYALVFYSSNKQKSNASLVDISGKNRMLSQRIAAMSQLVASLDEDSLNDKAKEELLKAVAAHDLALTVLKEGGSIPGVNSDEPLPAAEKEIKEKLTEVQEYFKEHKRLVNILVTEPKKIVITTDSVEIKKENPIFSDALKTLQRRFVSGTLLKYNIEITNMFVAKANNSRSNFTLLLMVLMLLNLLAILTAFLLLQKYISIPLKYLLSITDRISRGDNSAVSTYESQDDIGKISDSINELTSNLRKATEFTIKIGKGDFTAHLDIQQGAISDNEQNLVTSLMNMKKRLIEVAEEDKKRNWATEGLAEFAEIFRLNHQLKDFGDVLIKNLLKQLGANQGGLYVLNDNYSDQLHLELISCYAYDRKKYMNKSIEIGEGLIGQAYLEKESIYLTEIPNDYIRITSGLGDANPSCILIVPLINNNSVEGILEIASFNKFQEHEILFIQKLAENIASALSNTKTNEKTKKLLKESQIQAEQLRSQEEEMRQNMEELSATQEQMVMKENEYLSVIKKLEEELAQK